MHFLLFLLWQRCCGDVALRGYAPTAGCVRFAQVTAALPPLLTLCVHYFGRADVTAPKVLVKHSTSRMPSELRRGRSVPVLRVRVHGYRYRGYVVLG